MNRKRYKFARDCSNLRVGIKRYVPEDRQEMYLDTLKSIREVAKFDVPKRPVIYSSRATQYEPAEFNATCPNCDEILDHEIQPNYCQWCGQELDWEEEYD